MFLSFFLKRFLKKSPTDLKNDLIDSQITLKLIEVLKLMKNVQVSKATKNNATQMLLTLSLYGSHLEASLQPVEIKLIKNA